MKGLGADKVIAYDKENIHQHKAKYDLAIDANGNLFHDAYQRMGQQGVVVGFTTLGHMFSLLFRKGLSKFPLQQFTANTKDLQSLASLVKDGKLNPQIEKIFFL